jgi:DNA-binding response OmpR family regulator
MAKVLIVDDDKSLCSSLNEWLKMKNYTVEMVHAGDDALEHLRAFEYDLIILDWNLPNVSGVEICRQFRSSGGVTPILMLTGKGSIHEKEEGFYAGADDYLTKPFQAQELVARVHALLRRPTAFIGPVISIRNIVLDTNRRRVTRDGTEIQFQPMEFTLLEFLMRHPTQVFSTEALMRRCWDSNAEISLDAIYTCIRRLRRKLDVDGQPSLITTVHGVGYSFDSDVVSDK